VGKSPETVDTGVVPEVVKHDLSGKDRGRDRSLPVHPTSVSFERKGVGPDRRKNKNPRKRKEGEKEP
jgi:hypothetical protein